MLVRVRLALFLVGLLFLGACAQTPSTTPSMVPSIGASPPPAGNLPPGCEPIELRTPSGDRIVLSGTWIQDVESSPMTWWIRTEGDCVWGAGHVEDVPAAGSFNTRPANVQSLNGRLGSDFVITGEILWLAPLPVGAPGNQARYAPLRMLIEFDDAGEVVLREDRQPGVAGPHCPDPGGYCPAPLVLRPVD